MIAIRRTGHGHLGNDLGILSGEYFLRRGEMPLVLRSDVFLNQAKDRVGAAECFEAFSTKARAFVFVIEGRESELFS